MELFNRMDMKSAKAPIAITVLVILVAGGAAFFVPLEKVVLIVAIALPTVFFTSLVARLIVGVRKRARSRNDHDLESTTRPGD